MELKKDSIFKNFVNQLKPANSSCCDVKIVESIKEQVSSAEQKSTTQK